jgi:hypothetical protein
VLIVVSFFSEFSVRSVAKKEKNLLQNEEGCESSRANSKADFT